MNDLGKLLDLPTNTRMQYEMAYRLLRMTQTRKKWNDKSMAASLYAETMIVRNLGLAGQAAFRSFLKRNDAMAKSKHHHALFMYQGRKLAAMLEQHIKEQRVLLQSIEMSAAYD